MHFPGKSSPRFFLGPPGPMGGAVVGLPALLSSLSGCQSRWLPGSQCGAQAGFPVLTAGAEPSRLVGSPFRGWNHLACHVYPYVWVSPLAHPTTI